MSTGYRSLFVAVLVLTLLSGCTARTNSGRKSTSASTTATDPAATFTSPESVDVADPNSPSTSPASQPNGSNAAPSSAPANSASAPTKCSSPAVTVALLSEGSAAQVQYAAIQVTNTSSVSCSLAGFASVSLVAAGATVGQPAAHAGAGGSVVLAPHGQATAKITDPSSCNAPLSDSARITLPDASAYVEVPAALRACALQVSAFSAG